MPAVTSRQRCYLALCRILRPLDDAQRQAALEELRSQIGLPLQIRPTHRLLDEEQLRRLAASERISVGAHCITHPVLSQLSSQRQEQEIFGSRAELERILGKRVAAFAYPFGGKADFNRTSGALVR